VNWCLCPPGLLPRKMHVSDISQMNVLHVMPDFPFPTNNGARADVWSRIVAMKSLGYRIDVLVMAQKLRPSPSHLRQVCEVVDGLHFVERRPLRKCLATRFPTYISRNATLSEHPLTREYDVTIMEAEDTLAITDNPTLRTGQRVLRVHNDEITYLREFLKAEEDFTRRQFLRLELMRLRPFVRRAHERVDQLWFISESEWKRFAAINPHARHKAAWLPPSIEIRNRPIRRVPGNKRVLFVGNLYTPLNREALRWYLQYVHPVLERIPDYELVVAGSTQGRSAAWMFAEDVRHYPRCTVHVDIEDTTSLYQNCAVFVNPMRAGAGVKLKTVHAIERGIPVVSTSIGNEGTGFHDAEHVKIADSPEGFVGAVTELLNDCRLRAAQAERAYQRLLARYDAVDNISRLMGRTVECSAYPVILAGKS
jgi:polysaccharide biosynthesis protein PslH